MESFINLSLFAISDHSFEDQILSICNFITTKTGKMKRLFLLVSKLIVFSLVMPFLSEAQDNHYSWKQFGARNSVLYNAGLSRFEDQAAVILNPATLSSAANSSFNFNTNAIGFNIINFENGLGQGFNLTNSNLAVLPAMAAGVVKPWKRQKDWVLGYALYHRNSDILNFTDRTETKKDVISESESPGAENYLSQYHLNTAMDEVSIVAGLGWKISPKISFGFSQTFTHRSQEYIENFSANAIPDLNTGATVDWVGTSYNIFFQFFKIFTHTKIGLTGKFGKWDLGLTLTTPALGIMGNGEMNADLSLINVRLGKDTTSARRNFLANGRFEDLKVNYKLPLSISFGASRQFGKVIMYGAIDWHSAIKKYAILNPGDASFIQPSTSENVLYTEQLLTVWEARRTVFNGSVAADWVISPDNHILFSFRSDNFYTNVRQDEEGFSIPKKAWNNYHATIGTQRDFGNSEWVIGIRLNRGARNDYPQPFSFTDPTEDNFFQGERKTGRITSTGIQLLISYTFKFGFLGKE
jgi:hypothetical protein